MAEGPCCVVSTQFPWVPRHADGLRGGSGDGPPPWPPVLLLPADVLSRWLRRAVGLHLCQSSSGSPFHLCAPPLCSSSSVCSKQGSRPSCSCGPGLYKKDFYIFKGYKKNPKRVCGQKSKVGTVHPWQTLEHQGPPQSLVQRPVLRHMPRGLPPQSVFSGRPQGGGG